MAGLDQDDITRKLGLGAGQARARRWPIALAVVLGLGLGAVVLFGRSGGTDIVYATEPVQRADLQVTVAATGTVEPTDLVEISSELSGTIESVHVDFNDQVEVGTLLARLDTTKLEAQLAVQRAALASAEAQLTVAEATLDEARETYDRGLELQARGVETEQAFIAHKAAFLRAQANVEAAIAARDLAQANLDVVQVDLDKSCICSPVKGIVLDRDVDEGQIVAASLSAPILFTLAEDLSRMELQVNIDEADIGMVAVGQSAVFTVDAYDDRSFPARITALRYASETVDGVVTYLGILTLDNSDGALRPGMTASADIVVAAVTDALVVPNAALRYAPPQEATPDQDDTGGSGLVGMIMPGRPGGGGSPVNTGKAVWVLRDGAPVEVPVKTGRSDGSVTVILAGDLAEGDRVITDQTDG